MLDEIDSLFPCLGIFLVKNFAIPMLVVLHQCCNTHFPGCTIENFAILCKHVDAWDFDPMISFKS